VLVALVAALSCLLPLQQKQLATERIAALLEDRRIKGQEEEAHRAQLNSQIESLTTRLKKAEEVLRTTTKEYILGAPPAPSAVAAANAEAARRARGACRAMVGEALFCAYGWGVQ
jgi:hypothetical protein